MKDHNFITTRDKTKTFFIICGGVCQVKFCTLLLSILALKRNKFLV